MAAAAVLAPRQAHMLGDVGQVDGFEPLEHHAAGLVAAGGRRLVVAARFRITSYNVCYTKLLRLSSISLLMSATV